MPKDFKVLYIIWGAMCLAVVLFAVISATIPVPPAEAPDPMLYVGLTMAALFSGGLGAVGVPMFMKHLGANTAWIMRCACSESVGLYGLVLAFVGAPITIWSAFFVASFALLLVARPNADAFTAWEMRRFGDDG